MLQLKCECCRKKGIQLFEKMLIRRERNLVCTECGTEFNISGLAWLGLAWLGSGRRDDFFLLLERCCCSPFYLWTFYTL